MRRKTQREQRDMIAKGNHKKIMAYIAKYPLCDEAEVALIKRGNHEEIMDYVSKFALSSKAELALITRDNAEEIEAMKARKS